MGICCGKEGSPRESGAQHEKDKAIPATTLNGGTHSHAHGKRAHAPPSLQTLSSGAETAAETDRRHLTTNLSLLHEDDYHSCRDDFSVISGSLSPRHSGCGSAELHADHAQDGGTAARASTTPTSRPPAGPPARTTGTTVSPFSGAQPPAVVPVCKEGEQQAEDDESPDISDEADGSTSKPVGCLSLLEVLSMRLHSPAGTSTDAHPISKPRSQRHARNTQLSADAKPSCGASLSRRDVSKPEDECSMCYEDGDGCHYNVRGLDYMKTKLKVQSDKSIYQLAAADMFTFDRKQSHIAQLVNLPAAPPAIHPMSPSSSACYPPLLIINLQMPTYAPSFFGGNDGPGWSIVYYFTLPEDFDPALFPNKKALGLFQRYVQNGKEADGSATRDRFKIIPRVVNVDEWAQTGPLSSGEHKLLSGYNEKPVLSRPQHKFFHEANYFEVDLDIHLYSFVARTALMSFMTRLKSIVFEIAFVIQGNAADELPEQVLGCGRIYRSDFAAQRRFSSFLPRAPEPHAEPDGVEPKT